MKALIAAAALSLFPHAKAVAQADSGTARLDPVVVTVTRGSQRSLLGSPFALSVTRPDSTRPGQRLTAVDEALALIPGLSSASRNNPSQDPRLSIRGFGARSAFGVRGIRVLRDGMPLTLPDGQTPLDYTSLESVGRIEVMRGSASALYGNASGGVIDIVTVEPAHSRVSIDAKQWAGSDAFFRSVAVASGRSGAIGYAGDIARTSSDGARDHSRSRSSLVFGRALYRSGQSRLAFTLMGLDNPVAQNPGALTLEEMRQNPRAADPQSIRRNARKAVRQIQVGSTVTRLLRGGEFAVSAYGGARSLDNPLTFAVVEIGRHTWGGNAAVRNGFYVAGLRHDLSVGMDLQWQNDLRRNFAACADTVASRPPTVTCPDPLSDRGVVSLDQRELVSSVGIYVSDDARLTERVSLTAGIRADRVTFEVRDRLLTSGNPDDSGERSMHSVSPIAGLVARLGALRSLYATVSSAFETPTATELGNQPDGTAGINRQLNPQRSVTLETGIRGVEGAVRYDLAAFTTRVADELVPFEIPESNGRRYFRNAGRTRRHGMEAGLEVERGWLGMSASYNYSRFRFSEFASGGADYAGNEIPGIPRHRVQAAARISSSHYFIVGETELASSSFADDANTFRAPGYDVLHLRGGLVPSRGRRRMEIVGGIQNVLDRRYASSVAVNAARLRYFEPAAPRSFTLGIAIGASGGGRSPD